MPIKPSRAVQLKTEEEFREVDYRVMGKAFEIHNELGPYFDEVVYKNELAFRLMEMGVSAVREFPIELVFQNYSKRVFVDLLVDNGIVYEVKTAASFAPAHRSQALNYLFGLSRLKRIQWVNIQNHQLHFQTLARSQHRLHQPAAMTFVLAIRVHCDRADQHQRTRPMALLL